MPLLLFSTENSNSYLNAFKLHNISYFDAIEKSQKLFSW